MLYKDKSLFAFKTHQSIKQSSTCRKLDIRIPGTAMCVCVCVSLGGHTVSLIWRLERHWRHQLRGSYGVQTFLIYLTCQHWLPRTNPRLWNRHRHTTASKIWGRTNTTPELLWAESKITPPVVEVRIGMRDGRKKIKKGWNGGVRC